MTTSEFTKKTGESEGFILPDNHVFIFKLNINYLYYVYF